MLITGENTKMNEPTKQKTVAELTSEELVLLLNEQYQQLHQIQTNITVITQEAQKRRQTSVKPEENTDG
jgi:hypothetical protein